MDDTTDTARLARELRNKAGMRSKPPSPMAAGVPFFVYDEDTRVLLSHAADALERLAAENAELRADLETHVPVLLEWLGENVTDDQAYLQARAWAHRVARKAAIDAAMAEGKGDG